MRIGLIMIGSSSVQPAPDCLGEIWILNTFKRRRLVAAVGLAQAQHTKTKRREAGHRREEAEPMVSGRPVRRATTSTDPIKLTRRVVTIPDRAHGHHCYDGARNQPRQQ